VLGETHTGVAGKKGTQKEARQLGKILKKARTEKKQCPLGKQALPNNQPRQRKKKD